MTCGRLLEGKVALVPGASRGVHRGLAAMLTLADV
jgi:NAD(P)-dependent dehydrogenase (short-subunit alcohol dehydrogenase family)